MNNLLTITDGHWPFENPGTMGNEQLWETGITIFWYVSNSNGRGKNTDTNTAVF